MRPCSSNLVTMHKAQTRIHFGAELTLVIALRRLGIRLRMAEVIARWAAVVEVVRRSHAVPQMIQRTVQREPVEVLSLRERRCMPVERVDPSGQRLVR